MSVKKHKYYKKKKTAVNSLQNISHFLYILLHFTLSLLELSACPFSHKRNIYYHRQGIGRKSFKELKKNPDTAFLPYLDLLFINISQNQYPCKQLILLSVYLIFVVLKIMENTIYINQIINYPIQHKIFMSCKINSSIS